VDGIFSVRLHPEFPEVCPFFKVLRYSYRKFVACLL